MKKVKFIILALIVVLSSTTLVGCKETPPTIDDIVNYVKTAWKIPDTSEDIIQLLESTAYGEDPVNNIPFKSEIGGILTINSMIKDMNAQNYSSAAQKGAEWLVPFGLKEIGYTWISSYVSLGFTVYDLGVAYFKYVNQEAFNTQIIWYLQWKDKPFNLTDDVIKQNYTNDGWIVGPNGHFMNPSSNSGYTSEDVFLVGHKFWDAKQSDQQRSENETAIKESFIDALKRLKAEKVQPTVLGTSTTISALSPLPPVTKLPITTPTTLTAPTSNTATTTVITPITTPTTVFIPKPTTPSTTTAIPAIMTVISSVSKITPDAKQTIIIQGRGFGNHSPYNGNSPYIQITDVNRSWNAGYIEANPAPGAGDAVTLNVTSWTDNQIIVSSFTGLYGQGWSLYEGDTIRIQVWNTQTLIGPASYFTTCSAWQNSQTTTTSLGTPVTINLVAQNMAFNLSSITVPAGVRVTINFNNKDSGVPHNFALYTNSSATPPALFQGYIVTGPASVTYTFMAPATPGIYFFRCDIHPTLMTGSFIVTAATTTTTSAVSNKIAFVSNRDGNPEIYVMNTDGSNQTRLTNNPAQDYDPSWSPDGSKIAFVSSRDGNPEIYIMNSDGTNMRRITSTQATESSPAWFPDGLRIIFVRDLVINNPMLSGFTTDVSRIFIIKTDGTGETQFAANLQGPKTDPVVYDPNFSITWFQNPVVSPDGNSIVFTNGNLYIVDLSGTGLSGLAGGAVNLQWKYSAWSPNGSMVLSTNSWGQITLFDMKTRKSIQLLPDNLRAGKPTWSTDGSKIAFDLLNDKGGGDIYTMQPDLTGGQQVNLIQLTKDGSNSNPAWEP